MKVKGVTLPMALRYDLRAKNDPFKDFSVKF